MSITEMTLLVVALLCLTFIVTRPQERSMRNEVNSPDKASGFIGVCYSRGKFKVIIAGREFPVNTYDVSPRVRTLFSKDPNKEFVSVENITVIEVRADSTPFYAIK